MPSGSRVRLAILGLGMVLAAGTVAPGARAQAQGGERAPQAKRVYHKGRSFRIPFAVSEADRSRIQEVILWVSEDAGYHWRMEARTTPDRPTFTFRAARDGEFWFAVQTRDVSGRLFPPADERTAEPSMKVVVDTEPPSLTVTPLPRRGTRAAVRWEVRDEHLKLASLSIRYQAEGDREWRDVPIHRPALIGQQDWDAATADPLQVRAAVADEAGNVQEVALTLPEGTPTNPALTTGAEAPAFGPPPAIAPAPSLASASTSAPAPSSRPASLPTPVEDDPFPMPGASGANPGGAMSGGYDPFPPTPGLAAAPPAPASATAGGGQSLPVPSPQFALQYAIDDAGPNGPAIVELWATRDGGRLWTRLGEDPDRVSPFPVDLSGLGSDGTFGLKLVARSAAGLGDDPPVPGETPQMWVEVDATPPLVQLGPARVGQGPYAGQVAIFWRATDLHLAARPVTLSYRPADQPDAPWRPIAGPLENSGRFIWAVPPDVPARFHVRVEVVDALGHVGSAETSGSAPILVDRARPRSRIIGLDPGPRSGAGPSARPLR